MDVQEFIKKHFWSYEEEKKRELEKCLNSGTEFKCWEPKCNYQWKSKPKEVFEKCPKCGSNRLHFKCGEIWYGIWHDENWD